MPPPRPTFRLLAISDRATLPVPWEEWLRALGLAGVDALQIREKDLDDRALHDLAREARALLPPETGLLVNGRLDVAIAAGADGVHLPADGVPARALRDRFGPGARIGRSTHTVEEVARARDDGVDYVTFGPVFATPGKGKPVGLAAVGQAVATGVPVFALGGVTLERLGDLAGTGAVGAAAIRLFQSPRALTEVVRIARERLGRV